MVNTTMFRPQTSDETKDYKMVGTKTPWEAFLRDLAVVEQIFAKEHKPFDSQCAKLDFKDEMRRIEVESLRVIGFVQEADLRAIKLDLESYGKEGLFELLEEDEDLQDKVIEGMRTQVKIGWTLKYRCKRRGHGISVFMPTAVYEERKKKKSKEA